MRPVDDRGAMEALLPHRPPMLLLDAVEQWDEGSIVCRAHIGDASVFAEAGRVRAVVLLEHMAQTVAALAGLRSRHAEPSPRAGFLVAVRTLDLAVATLAPGDDLRISARRDGGDDDLGRFEVHVERGGEVVARGELTVLRPEEGAT